MLDRRTFTVGLLAAAAAWAAPSPVRAAAKVTVFAAASLKNALDEASAAWMAETGRETANSYAASSALARQIEAGAPADLFISADLDWMDYLAGKKLVDPASEVRLLGNTLVLVAPAQSTGSITLAPGFDLAGLLKGGRLAIGDVKSVPAGRYAKASLEKLGVWPQVENNLAQAENVRAALKLVATGEAPAGIVYATDAREETKVRVLGTFPPDSHPPIVYPAALVTGRASPEAAAFLAFLQSAKARAIFVAHGFEAPAVP